MPTTPPHTVYVVTDAPPREYTTATRQPELWPAIRDNATMLIVAVPIMATSALLIGLLFGWHPVILGLAAILASPALANLLDLFGAAVGWPPLTWTARQIIARRRTREGDHPDGR